MLMLTSLPPHTVAHAFVRRMRGEAQAVLVKAEDGLHYVVKCSNNPQHRRVLINEYLASGMLRSLGIPTPAVALVEFTSSFLASHPELCFDTRRGKTPVTPGIHFGSAFPGDPTHARIYDFLPDGMFSNVLNASDFLGALVFDKWVCNTDYRQAIYIAGQPAPSGRRPHGGGSGNWFRAEMVDNGYAFGGCEWALWESPIQGLSFSKAVYAGVKSLHQFGPWLDKVSRFPAERLFHLAKAVPEAWFQDDQGVFEGMLERLLARRRRIVDLVADCPFLDSLRMPPGCATRPASPSYFASMK